MGDPLQPRQVESKGALLKRSGRCAGPAGSSVKGRRIAVLAAAFLCIGMVSSSAAARDPAPARERGRLTGELLGLEAERQAAYARGDRAVLERQLAAEYVHTNLRGGQTNRAQELAFYAPGMFSLERGEVADVEVRDYGDTAVLLGVVHWRGAAYRPAPGRTVDLSGSFRVTRVYVWRDRRWQLATSHASKMD